MNTYKSFFLSFIFLLTTFVSFGQSSYRIIQVYENDVEGNGKSATEFPIAEIDSISNYSNVMEIHHNSESTSLHFIKHIDSICVRNVVGTTYDMVWGWKILGLVNDGGISFVPDLSMPADFYNYSQTPFIVRNYIFDDGTIGYGGRANDYGYINSGPIVSNNSYGPYNYKGGEYKDNKITTTESNYFAQEVKGLDFNNFKPTVNEFYYRGDESVRYDTPLWGQYQSYTISGPNRIWFTSEEIEKLNAYFGHEATYGEILDLQVGELIDIMGSSDWDNPYLGLPTGFYSGGFAHQVEVGLENATDFYGRDLSWEYTFIELDGFFINRDESGAYMIPWHRNISTPNIKMEMEIIQEDDVKTIGVLKRTATHEFKYENTIDGLPYSDMQSLDLWEGYYPSVTLEDIGYDTLVVYKENPNAPFKINRPHYLYPSARKIESPHEVMISQQAFWLEANEEFFKNGEHDFDIEYSTDVDWLELEVDSGFISDKNYRVFHLYTKPHNETLDDRFGNIVFGLKGTDYSDTIHVMQSGSQFSEIDQEEFHLDYKGGEINITGRTNDPEHIDVRWNVDWIVNPSETRAIQEIAFPLQVLENTSTESRSATIIVYEGKYTNFEVRRIKVTQEGRPEYIDSKVVATPQPKRLNMLDEIFKTHQPGIIMRVTK